MNHERVLGLLRYALARANEQGGRSLSKTQMTKLVYLADLEYARRHDGETYTNVHWVFFHFGPWAKEIDTVIDEVINLPDVILNKRFNEDKGFDWKVYRAKNWSPDTEANPLTLKATVPIDRAIREFETLAELLQHVYQSEPMLHAAPKEALDFGLVATNITLKTSPKIPDVISKTQRRKRREKLAAKKQEFSERLAQKRLVKSKLETKPRYDEVFHQGVEMLEDDSNIGTTEGLVEFDESIWKSDMRTLKEDD